MRVHNECRNLPLGPHDGLSTDVEVMWVRTPRFNGMEATGCVLEK
jgi:hypothetical protein